MDVPAHGTFPLNKGEHANLPSVSIIMPTNGPGASWSCDGRIARQTYPKSLAKRSLSWTTRRNLSARPKQTKRLQSILGQTKLLYKNSRSPRLSAKSATLYLWPPETSSPWDDDDFYGRASPSSSGSLAKGSADIAVLPHAYDTADGTVFEAKSKVFGWGPHFGTLVYRKSLCNIVKFNDWSLSEDVAFALELVKKLGYSFKVVSDAPTGTFVVSRHKANTWKWGKNMFKDGIEVPAETIFGDSIDTTELSKLASLVPKLLKRRLSNPTPAANTHSIDLNFFKSRRFFLDSTYERQLIGGDLSSGSGSGLGSGSGSGSGSGGVDEMTLVTCAKSINAGKGGCLLIEGEDMYTCEMDPKYFYHKGVCTNDGGHWCEPFDDGEYEESTRRVIRVQQSTSMSTRSSSLSYVRYPPPFR